MLQALSGPFCTTDIKHIDNGTGEPAHLAIGIETLYYAQIDNIFLIM